VIIIIKILDLGCGKNKIKVPNAKVIGLDIVKHHAVDVVHDLTKFPYPLEDKEFDEVHASHVLEHIEHNKDFFKLMEEVYRILKTNGLFIIRVPFWKSYMSYGFPEHTRFFGIRYFNYFDHSLPRESGHLSRFSKCNFKVIERKFNMIVSGRLKFLNFFNPIYNLNQNLTEIFLSNILAPEEIIFKLRKVGLEKAHE